MQRVMILGGPGSGKSTLAVRLGAITGLPVIHIDRLYWAPGWVKREDEAYRRSVRDAAAGERWIIEGNYSKTIPDRIARADTVIFLDLPTGLRVRRILWRTLRHYGRARPDMPEGCRERFDWDFLKWTAGYRTRSRPEALALLEDAPARLMIRRLRSPSDVRRFVRSCAAAQSVRC